MKSVYCAKRLASFINFVSPPTMLPRASQVFFFFFNPGSEVFACIFPQVIAGTREIYKLMKYAQVCERWMKSLNRTKLHSVNDDRILKNERRKKPSSSIGSYQYNNV